MDAFGSINVTAQIVLSHPRDITPFLLYRKFNFYFTSFAATVRNSASGNARTNHPTVIKLLLAVATITEDSIIFFWMCLFEWSSAIFDIL